MRNKIVIVILSVLGIAAIGFGVMYFTYLAPMNETLKEVRTMDIKDVELESLKDGVYQGEYSYSSTTCRVEVVLKDHRIIEIKVLDNGRTEYAKKAEEALERVKKQQSLQVDVVSSATTTSKALLKAVENALSSGAVK